MRDDTRDMDQVLESIKRSESAILVRTCREINGRFVDYLADLVSARCGWLDVQEKKKLKSKEKVESGGSTQFKKENESSRGRKIKRERGKERKKRVGEERERVHMPRDPCHGTLPSRFNSTCNAR